MEWERFKQQKEKNLDEAFRRGEVDKGILLLLKKINKHKEWVTTSSCFGRIVLLEFAEKKIESSFYRKWHRKVKTKEVIDAIRQYNRKKKLWFRFEPFILHVSTKDIDAAKKFIDAVRSIGIKRGGIQTITPNRVSIEIQGNQNIVMPADVISNWGLVVKLANDMFSKNKEKIKQLERLF